VRCTQVEKIGNRLPCEQLYLARDLAPLESVQSDLVELSAISLKTEEGDGPADVDRKP
jgi:hypothetical protein